jgi:polysaccharide chain length determinant protein (PEP-CTERM system associated)
MDSFLRHRWLFVVSVLTIIALICAYGLLRPKTYTTGYTVMLNNQAVPNPLTNYADSITWEGVTELCNHFQSLVSTKDFMQNALKNPDGTAIGLAHPINFNDQDQLLDLQKSIIVNPVSADQFTVTVTTRDPNDGLKILNAIISSFIERNAQEKSAGDSENVAFIGQQLSSYKDKLQTAEANLSTFKAENASHMPSQQDAIVQQLSNLQAEQQDMQLQMASENDRIAFLTRQIKQTPASITANQQMGRSYLDTQIIELQGQLDNAITVKQEKPNHPEVISLKAALARLEKLRAAKQKSGAEEASSVLTRDVQPNPAYEALKTQLFEDQLQVQTLQAKMQQLAGAISQAQTGASQVPAEERELADLTRNYDIYRSNYDTLEQRLTAARIDEELHLRQQRDAYEALLTSPPQASASAKKMIILYVGGIFLALIVGIGLVVLSEWMDRSLRDPLDTQRALGVAVLAVLPEAAALRFGDNGYRGLGGPPNKRLGRGKTIRALQSPTGAAPTASAVSASTASEDLKTSSGRRSWFPAGTSPEEAHD